MKPFIIGLLIFLTIAGYIGYGAYSVIVLGVKRNKIFWEQEASKPVPSDAIRLVALGDSTMQAIGANEPLEGTAGRVAQYLQDKTGRPVHITNYSVSGARAKQVVSEQLPKAKLDQADVIIIAVGANDSSHKTSLSEFESDIKTITQIVPASKTIMADVALVDNREPYQVILQKYREPAGIFKADLKTGFKDAPSSVLSAWRLTAKDFFHPSSYGYTFWFKAFVPALDTLIDRLKKA